MKSLLRNKSLRRNTIVSIFTTALDAAVLALLYRVLHLNLALATFMGTVVGATSNFTFNRLWSFQASNGTAHWQLLRFLPVQAGSSGLQTLGVPVFTTYVGLPFLASKLVVSVLVYLCWNYPMNRYWVFRRFGSEASRPSPGAPADTSTPAV